MHRRLPRRLLPGTTTPGGAAGTAAAVLLLAVLLDAEPLLATARGMPLGARRDVSVAVMERVVDLSRAAHLDVPRRALDDVLGHERRAAPPAAVPVPVPTPVPSSAPAPDERRAPSPADPLRVLVLGDSMAQAPGLALTSLTGRASAVRVELDFRFSSGLSRPDFFDWPSRIVQRLGERRPPEALVVSFGANDAQGMVGAEGVLKFGTQAWDLEYARRVAAVMELLRRSGVPTYWVGQPIARSSSYSDRMARLDGIYRREAARHPGNRYVDSWSLFATAEGGYSAYLPTDDGLTRMRLGDGIHLTPAGGERLARVLLDLLHRDWRLP